MRVPVFLCGIALSLLLAASPALAALSQMLEDPDGGEIRALIIGIDAYEHVRQLKGAVADARDIEQSLRNMGTSDITALIDAQANRANLLQKMNALIERTKPNDLIILSIAGHGSQEPEHIKGSEPDGFEDVFLLSGFETTPQGSVQRVLASEFNFFMRQFEAKGAKVLFVADTCHGGGMARDVDPRAAEMSFRQVPSYSLSVDLLKPVTSEAEPDTELDLERTAFVAAVDRHTKAPEVKIPGIDGLRGALSYAVARAIEGNADADHDGKVTLKELFANVRQVVYQLSDQRQNIVTKASPGRSVDRDVVFGLTRGLSLSPPPPPPPAAANASPQPPQRAPASVPEKPTAAPPPPEPETAKPLAPIRLAALDGNASSLTKLTARTAAVEIVRPIDDPDLIWDPKSHDVISWGDVIAYKVDPTELSTVVDRTVAIRELKKTATKAPQMLRVVPNDAQHHGGEAIQIELSDVAGRAVILFDISGDGTIQMLYPIGSDPAPTGAQTIRLPLRVREPYGADQVVAVSSTRRIAELEEALLQLNQRKVPGQLIKLMTKYLPADARVGSIGFFTAP